MSDQETYDACLWALEMGYRHIDTAEWYENEVCVGKAVAAFCKKSGISREEIFITSKLKNNRTYSSALKDLRASLKRSNLDYFDLYLMHSPIGGPSVREEIWSAMIDAQKEGLVRSIGVSNFGVRHIQEIIDQNVSLPTINQIDLHPFMRHPDIVKICESNGIVLEAWAPLARGYKFSHPSVIKISKKHSKSPAQILLRWGIQHNHVVIPKSVSKERIQANSEIFDFCLSEEDMNELDGLDEYLVTDWDVVDTP
ncbi:aldo-keto reductase [Tremella mesenterica]|uniref:Aldo-keto reductase n=1 Tax=Tremella mesenterica TaxID=5217 RepID=A0A4Q1BGH5_TREME|nr:aldo-keto reductase [Tremella mesenterica]